MTTQSAIAAVGLALVVSSVIGSTAADQSSSATLTTVALRVHRMNEMVAFYEEALGARFRVVTTGTLQSRFGQVGAITLKLVPIRDAVDFDGFAVHQMGFTVADVQRIIDVAVKHGGKLHQAPTSVDGQLHAAIRDPDGNTIELYGRR